VDGELTSADRAAVVELEEQPVPTGRWKLGLEQETVLFGVDVEVGEVAGA
jgi:hypothetical protein